MMKTCPGYTGTGIAGGAGSYNQQPHQLEAGDVNFSPGKNQCRTCYRAYAADWRAKRAALGGGSVGTSRRTARQGPIVMPNFVRPGGAPVAPPLAGRTAAQGPAPAAPAPSADPADPDEPVEEFVTDEDLAGSRSHTYVPQAGLAELWSAVTLAVAEGDPPANLIFLGPSGCGKTEGAEFLAALVGLPFTKVDAPSMTDPESWFGTREVVEQDGVSVTVYRPSIFVQAISEPGVVLLDEINRVPDVVRNIILPLADSTHRVTNPLTGEVVYKHPHCFLIMTGNRGLQFTGTYAIDPALMTRSLTVPFRYVPEPVERQIAMEATGCDEEVAALFVRFAAESRTRANQNIDFSPISTREVIQASRLVKHGLSTDVAAHAVMIDAASPEGGPSSVQAELERLWVGIRMTPAPVCGEEQEVNGVMTGLTCVKDKHHSGDHADASGQTWS